MKASRGSHPEGCVSGKPDAILEQVFLHPIGLFHLASQGRVFCLHQGFSLGSNRIAPCHHRRCARVVLHGGGKRVSSCQVGLESYGSGSLFLSRPLLVVRMCLHCLFIVAKGNGSRNTVYALNSPIIERKSFARSRSLIAFSFISMLSAATSEALSLTFLISTDTLSATIEL